MGLRLNLLRSVEGTLVRWWRTGLCAGSHFHAALLWEVSSKCSGLLSQFFREAVAVASVTKQCVCLHALLCTRTCNIEAKSCKLECATPRGSPSSKRISSGTTPWVPGLVCSTEKYRSWLCTQRHACTWSMRRKSFHCGQPGFSQVHYSSHFIALGLLFCVCFFNLYFTFWASWLRSRPINFPI